MMATDRELERKARQVTVVREIAKKVIEESQNRNGEEPMCSSVAFCEADLIAEVCLVTCRDLYGKADLAVHVARMVHNRVCERVEWHQAQEEIGLLTLA